MKIVDIEEKIHDFAEQLYMAGYYERKEVDQGDNVEYYKQGLNDAWECAKKVWQMDYYTLIKVFDDIKHDIEMKGTTIIFDNYSADEVIQKIEEYEQKQINEIKIGDEVKNKPNETPRKGIVVGMTNYYPLYNQAALWLLMPKYNCPQVVKKDEYIKTGKHFSQISEALKAMEE